MSLGRSLPTSLFLIGIVACSTTTAADDDRSEIEAGQPDPALAGACDRLVEAPPIEWPVAIAELEAGFERSQLADALLAAAARHPDRLGAECAIAMAARSADIRLSTVLLAILDHPRATPAVAARAALAMAGTDSRAGLDRLTAVVRDSQRPTLVRTAAAVARLEGGDREFALEFLLAILVAGTGEGASVRAEYSIADSPRWALERTLAIEALGRAAGGVDFGLRADSDWPTLNAGARRIRAHFREAR